MKYLFGAALALSLLGGSALAAGYDRDDYGYHGYHTGYGDRDDRYHHSDYDHDRSWHHHSYHHHRYHSYYRYRDRGYDSYRRHDNDRDDYDDDRR